MNLKSLFQLFKLPKKGGEKDYEKSEKQEFTRFALSFTNLEDSPSYELTDHFTLGSDFGEMVLEDCNLSPKHATFSLEDGVVTIMDHGSSAGTYIGNHRIEAGKSVILSDGDIVVMGDVQVQLLSQETGIADIKIDQAKVTEEPFEDKLSEAFEGKKDESEVGLEEEVKTENVVNSPEQVAPEKTREIYLEGHLGPMAGQVTLKEDGTAAHRIQAIRAKKNTGEKARKKEKIVIKGKTERSANTLPRIVGIFFDLISIIILYQIFSPFDDFRSAVNLLPELWIQYIGPEWVKLIDLIDQRSLYEQVLIDVGPITKELFEEFIISTLLSLLFIWRLGWSLAIGTSLGMWMAGIRSYEVGLYKRLGGALREILGVFTFPLVLFDLPALFSRRTFKEIVTRTHLYTLSKATIIFSWILFFPLVMTLLIVSPLFRGMELNEKISISDELSVRLKKKVEEGGPVAITYDVYKSHWFGLSLELDPLKWIVVPKFSWAQTEKGSILQPALVFHHEHDIKMPILLSRNFDWYKLLNLPMSHNPFLQKSFPEIWGYVQSQRLKDIKNIQYRPSETQKKKFEVELQQLIATAFNLDVENILEHIIDHGPLIKGLIEFRHELIALLDGTQEGDWKFRLHGSTIVLIHEVSGLKPYDLIVPLNQGRGRIFKINYGSMNEKRNLHKATKGFWEKLTWGDETLSEGERSPAVIDIISQLAAQNKIDEASCEKLFSLYFDMASQVIDFSRDDQRSQSVHQSLKSVIDIFARFQGIENASMDPELIEKLINKLKEVLMNLENSNKAYFQNQLG